MVTPKAFLRLALLLAATTADDCPFAATERIWSRDRKTWQTPAREAPPRWHELDAATQKAFTRCGRARVDEGTYVDDSGRGNGTFYRFSAKDVASYVTRAGEVAARATEQGARAALARGRRPRDNDVWLLEALAAHARGRRGRHVARPRRASREVPQVHRGARVLVVGSMEPWHEALCLAFGAAKVTTVDYNRLHYAHPRRRAARKPFRRRRPRRASGRASKFGRDTCSARAEAPRRPGAKDRGRLLGEPGDL